MNKAGLIAKIAEVNGVTKVEAQKQLEGVITAIEAGLKEDGIVDVKGTIKLEAVEVEAKPEREVRNPLTGEMVTAKAKPATKKVKVKVGKSIIENIL